MNRNARLLLVASALCTSASLNATTQDSALGTFTVAGKTTRFTQIYATLEASPTEATQNYLILLASDVAVAPADRSPERLSKLAQAGSLHAVRLLWKYGTDGIAVVPYHSAIAESGHAFASLATVNLTTLSDTRVDAEFKSKMLGQTWFFNAIVKATVARGGVASLEPAVAVSLPTAPGPGGKSDAAALKRSLGAMGYEYKPEDFFRAIADRKAQAVTQFIQAGMSPNQKDDQGHFALNYAVLFCAQSPDESAAVIEALLAGKADVKTKNPQNGTTALVDATQSCSVAAIQALVKAGSDLTAKANSGMTALQLAKIFQRADVVAVLEKAGRK